VQTFCHFFGAVKRHSINGLFHYINNANGYDDNKELILYPPYNVHYPGKQVKLLQLWDKLRIPHQKKKQLYGQSLEISGMEVNAEEMTITMMEDQK